MLDYNPLFHQFVRLKADDRIWDATVLIKNRHGLATRPQRLLVLEHHSATRAGLLTERSR